MAVNVTLHLPDESVQVLDENFPVPVPDAFVQVIVPVYGGAPW